MGTKFRRSRFQKIRRFRGVSKRKLANDLSVNKETITAWEKGKKEPKQKTISRIASILDCTVDYLMGSRNPEDQPDFGKPTSSKSRLGFILRLLLVGVAVYGLVKILPSIL